MVTKKLLLLIVMACSSHINAQISMNDIQIPGILTIGSYSKLIESQGYPHSCFTSSITPISQRCLKKGESVAPQYKLQCEYLLYDAYEYVHVGDSVQLVFVDLRKSKAIIYLKDIAITRKITQKEFLSDMAEKGWWSDEMCQYRIGRIESHYYSFSNVKNFSIDYREDPYSPVLFTFYNRIFDKRIWWIELPIMRIGGIVH